MNISIFPYFYDYLKINYFTLCFLGFLFLLAAVRWVKFPFHFQTKWCLIGILALGIFLRMAWLGSSSHQPMMTRETPGLLENDMINIHAIELTQGIWFHDSLGQPTGRRPIGYPMFLALLYKTFGIHVEIVWIAHLILYLITAWLIYLIGRLVFSEGVGFLAAFLFSIYPISIYSVKLITDEHLLLPVWYLGLYLLFKELKGERLRFDWLIYGLIFGYATMIRTHTIFMPAVVGIAWLMKKFALPKVIAVVFFTALTMQVINLPWVIRNYKAWGVPVIYTATSPFIYAQLNFSTTPEGGGHIPLKGEVGYSPELEQAIKSGNEGLVHRLANREMRRWILRNPILVLRLGIARLLSFMAWNRKEGVWPLWYQFYPGHHEENKGFVVRHEKIFEELAYIAYYIVLFGALVSIGMLWKGWGKLSVDMKKAIIVLGSIFAFYFLEHMLIYPFRKYRYPIEPLMILISCYFFYHLATPLSWSRWIYKFRGK